MTLGRRLLCSIVGSGFCLYLNLSAAGAQKSGQAKPLEDLFLQPKVMQISITIPAAGFAALHAKPRTYVRAALEEGGVRYADIGVRLKGNGSFQPHSNVSITHQIGRA